MTINIFYYIFSYKYIFLYKVKNGNNFYDECIDDCLSVVFWKKIYFQFSTLKKIYENEDA